VDGPTGSGGRRERHKFIVRGDRQTAVENCEPEIEDHEEHPEKDHETEEFNAVWCHVAAIEADMRLITCPGIACPSAELAIAPPAAEIDVRPAGAGVGSPGRPPPGRARSSQTVGGVQSLVAAARSDIVRGSRGAGRLAADFKPLATRLARRPAGATFSRPTLPVCRA
jgi:hypothetical protein